MALSGLYICAFVMWSVCTKTMVTRVWCPYRWGSQPAVLIFGTVHVPVKGIELTVAEVFHVH